MSIGYASAIRQDLPEKQVAEGPVSCPVDVRQYALGPPQVAGSDPSPAQKIGTSKNVLCPIQTASDVQVWPS